MCVSSFGKSRRIHIAVQYLLSKADQVCMIAYAFDGPGIVCMMGNVLSLAIAITLATNEAEARGNANTALAVQRLRKLMRAAQKLITEIFSGSSRATAVR